MIAIIGIFYGLMALPFIVLGMIFGFIHDAFKNGILFEKFLYNYMVALRKAKP